MSAPDLERLEAIIDASGVPQRIEARLPRGVRARQLSVRSLLIGILLCLSDDRPAHLARVHRALIGLPETEKHRLSVIAAGKSGPHLLTYRQTERTFGLIVKALAKDHPDGQPSQILAEITDALIKVSVQVAGVPDTGSYAIDWTDYESFARPSSRKHTSGQESRTGQPHSDASGKPQTASDREDGTDRDRCEDEQPSCADPEGWWGHRKTNHPGKAQTFFGYYLQAATIVKQEGGPEIPELLARITLASCKHDPPQMIVPVIERMREDGIPIGDLLADSGYSYRQPESFARPIRALGANLVIDLHPNDRGMKGTFQGAVICNGNLYCPATPKTLFQIGPPAPGATEEELAIHDQKTAELARYKLSPLTIPDQDGYQRVICPAVRGKIRCPHRPASISLSHEHPTILDPPEHPPACCKQQTITIPPSVAAKTRQKHDYPSKSHRASYARRTAVERAFSRLHNPAATNITRGWCRLIGLTGNTIMLACATIITNIRTTDAFTARQAEDQQRAEHGLPPRRRRRRAESPHKPTTNANAPPTITA